MVNDLIPLSKAKNPDDEPTDLSAQKAVKKRLLPYITTWLKQDSKSEEAREINAENAREKKATTIPKIITDLLGMQRLDKWPDTDDYDGSQKIYFPMTSDSPEQLVPLPATPEKFLEIVSIYEASREVPAWALVQTRIVREEAAPDLDNPQAIARRMIRAIRGVKDLTRLFALTQIDEDTAINEAEKEKLRTGLFINSEGDWALDEIVNIDGEQTTLKDEVEKRALEIIALDMGKLSNLDDFARYRTEVARFKFYNPPTRVRANAILKDNLRRILESMVESAPSREALEQILDGAARTAYGVEGTAIYMTREEIASIRKTAKARKKGL